MCFSPSLCFAVAKFVRPSPSPPPPCTNVWSQNDSIILTRLFFLPRREARGSVGDLDWLTTALPPVGWGTATHATTLCICRLPAPHYYYYTPWPQVAPLQRQPPIGSLLGTFSPSIGVNNLPSGLRLARSSFSRIYRPNVYVFVYVNFVYGSSSLHSPWSLHLMRATLHVCCFCATFFSLSCNTSNLKLLSGTDQLKSLGSDAAVKFILDGYQILPQIRKGLRMYKYIYTHLQTNLYGESLQIENTTITREHML